MTDQNEDYAVVYAAENEMTANIVKSALEDEGIEAVIRPLHTSWLDGALVPAEGRWGEVLVQKEDADRAAAVLAEYGEIQ